MHTTAKLIINFPRKIVTISMEMAGQDYIDDGAVLVTF
jgi:hypothetical protein